MAMHLFAGDRKLMARQNVHKPQMDRRLLGPFRFGLADLGPLILEDSAPRVDVRDSKATHMYTCITCMV